MVEGLFVTCWFVMKVVVAVKSSSRYRIQTVKSIKIEQDGC